MNHEKPEKLEELTHHEREAPHSHLIQGLSPILFTLILSLDGWVLHWTTQLNDIVPLIVRGILCVVFLSLAVYLMNSSHKILFRDHKPSDTLITEGILKRVRNPMYLGIMCIYLAFFFLSMSLIALG
ncbi:MAG: methyltransferase family protein, partial [Promethearchaeota archaeon]